MKRLRRWAGAALLLSLALFSSSAAEKPGGWTSSPIVRGRKPPAVSIEQAIGIARRAIQDAKIDTSYEYLAGARYIADAWDVPEFLKEVADGPFWHVWFQDPSVQAGEPPARDRHSVLVYSVTRTAFATDRLPGSPQIPADAQEKVANGKAPALTIDQAVATARKGVLQQQTQLGSRHLARAVFTPDATHLPAAMREFADGPHWHIWYEDPEAPRATDAQHLRISVMVFATNRVSIISH